MDPLTVAGILGAAGAGGGGGVKVSQSLSNTQTSNVAANPIVSIAFGGGSSPSGGGSATGSPSASATGGYDSFGLPSYYGIGQTQSRLTVPTGYNDIDRAPGVGNATTTLSKAGGLFSDPIMLAALAGVAFLLLTSKKGKG